MTIGSDVHERIGGGGVYLRRLSAPTNRGLYPSPRQHPRHPAASHSIRSGYHAMTQPLQIHPGHLAANVVLARRQGGDPKHVLDTALRRGLVAMA